MLKVPAPSPPVPQVSTRASGAGRETGTAAARIARANAAISATVSPFIRSAVRNPPIWAGVAAPRTISSITPPASAGVRSVPEETRAIASRIMPGPPCRRGSLPSAGSRPE